MREPSEIAQAARAASRRLPRLPPELRARALDLAVQGLEASTREILDANATDVTAARQQGLGEAFLDRLALSSERVRAMGSAIREIANQLDPIGGIDGMWKRPNGLMVGRMRVPLGVILIIYESRPNVTSDAAALCLKSGNALILRGGSEALRSNQAIGRVWSDACNKAGLPAGTIQVIETSDREVLLDLLRREEEIDLCIPRGGESLIRFVSENARVPVIKHYKGVCHIFVDEMADLSVALDLCENAKAQRPATCNAVETILVHEKAASEFLPRLAERFARVAVEVRADDRAREVVPSWKRASEQDWSTEYLDRIVSLRIVRDLDEGMEHIDRYGSNHTEAIVTRDHNTARQFLERCHSSTVLVNASTRLADGGELGLGAEIGISTSRIHAYGPMGIRELTTTKFVVLGNGQVRS